MRVLGETTLFGEPTLDPELDAYTRSLTDDWDTLARDVPEFRVVQEMALANGLADRKSVV